MADNFNVLDHAPGAVRVARGYLTPGDFTTTNVGATRTQVTGITCSLTAAVGDYVEFIPSFLHNPAGASFLDIAVKVSGSFVRYSSSGTNTPSSEGDPALYADPAFCSGPAVFGFVVEAGDLDAGAVVFALVYSGTGTTAVVHASSTYPFRWRAINFGPPTT
jgi:hypothetical protein